MRRAFGKFDSDNNGLLDLKEVVVLVNRMPRISFPFL